MKTLYLRFWEANADVCQALQQEGAPCDIRSTSEMVSWEIWKMQVREREHLPAAGEAGQEVGLTLVLVLVANAIHIRGSGHQLHGFEAVVVPVMVVISTTAS